jgi:hypothetical protein
MSANKREDSSNSNIGLRLPTEDGGVNASSTTVSISDSALGAVAIGAGAIAQGTVHITAGTVIWGGADSRTPKNNEPTGSVALTDIASCPSFSELVSRFTEKPFYDSPYKLQAKQRSLALLRILADFRELDLAENRKWLLWELFHALLKHPGPPISPRYYRYRYHCTMKLGTRPRSTGEPLVTPTAEMVDRWRGQIYALGPVAANSEALTTSFETLVPGRRGHQSQQKARYLPSVDSARYPTFLRSNPYLGEDIRWILNALQTKLTLVSTGEAHAMLFDLQSLIMGTSGRGLVMAFGHDTHDICNASSPLAKPCPEMRHGTHLTLQVYDGFFRTLTTTWICEDCERSFWEADVDLMSGESNLHMG